MDFDYSPKVLEAKERLEAFMEANVYPAEEEHHEPGAPFHPHGVAARWAPRLRPALLRRPRLRGGSGLQPRQQPLRGTVAPGSLAQSADAISATIASSLPV